MKKFSFALVLLALIFGLHNTVLATPITGTYPIPGTLKTGTWQEDFPNGMGQPGSLLKATSSGTPLQWSLDMTGLGAKPYDGTLQPCPPNATKQVSWDYQTLYTGTITIGGSLTNDGNALSFSANAVNYNVQYGKYIDPLLRPLLEFRFYGSGTYTDPGTNNAYTIDFAAYYYGAAKLNGSLVGDTLKTASVTIAPAPVPEPATMLLLGSGLMGFGIWARRFRRK